MGFLIFLAGILLARLTWKLLSKRYPKFRPDRNFKVSRSEFRSNAKAYR